MVSKQRNNRTSIDASDCGNVLTLAPCTERLDCVPVRVLFGVVVDDDSLDLY
jgi:hypothetical protein